MTISRRQFLRLGGLTAAGASATACNVIGRQLAKETIPESLSLPAPIAPSGTGDEERFGQPDPRWRILNRAGYGPRPGEYERVAGMGLAAYVEEQLHPEEIEDTAVDLMLRRLTLYPMDVSQLMAQEPKDAARELIATTMTRAVYSKRQMYEAMVEFWSDHFNIYIRKNGNMPLLKIIDDRDVIRPHALGNFGDLLAASVRSPAMLVYLDNARNQKGKPNENYARELMELHTIGVDAGYSQQDVKELARALTGWTVGRRGRRQGRFVFIGEQHDSGEKRVLGHTLPEGQGQRDVEQMLEILATHSATSRFIATKLVRHFVADVPPESLIDRVDRTFQETTGDIKSMLRIIFLSDEFAEAPMKLKRPFSYMISALRSLGADLSPTRQLGRWLEMLGQPLFQWPPPDGYPDVSDAWTTHLLPRWNFALALVHGHIPRTNTPMERLVRDSNIVDTSGVLNLIAGLLFGRSLDEKSEILIRDYVGQGSLKDRDTQQRLKDGVALMLAGPAFQWT